jgi:regulator of cell morphogenesis and NO signaling
MTDVQDRSLGDLVTANPAAARVLERHGLDYCCRGGQTLGDACASAGVDATTVTAEIDAVDVSDDTNWTSFDPPALVEHIVASHHRYLWEELPLLDALASKVERVHGQRHPELAEVRRRVAELRADLEPHLLKEEQVLFPAIAALAAGQTEFPFGSVAKPIHMMVIEHERAGELLALLRAATNSYQVPADGCASYRSLYERLAALEVDTHVHIHKENNVLFPAALHMAEG